MYNSRGFIIAHGAGAQLQELLYIIIIIISRHYGSMYLCTRKALHEVINK